VEPRRSEEVNVMRQRLKPKQAWSAEATSIILRNNRCQDARDALILHLKEPSVYLEPILIDSSSELEIKAIWTIALKTKKMRWESFDEREFVKQMDKTAPVLARPRLTEGAIDLWRWFSQPELHRFWERWKTRTGSRGSDPGYFAKALLIVTATMGDSPYFQANYDRLAKWDKQLRVVFDWIERETAAACGRAPQFFGLKPYQKAMDQIANLVDPMKNRYLLTTDDLIDTNIEMIKALHAIHPSVGLRLGIDATDITAHVKQIGKQDSSEKERRVRRGAVNAKYHIIERDGKIFKSWRGYYLYILGDLATNVPLVWCLRPGPGDGRTDTTALRYLLNELYEKWGDDCPTEFVVADRAWDNKEAVEMCAVDFGIHLIVDRDEPSWKRHPTYLPRKPRLGRREGAAEVSHFDGRGVAYCRRHNLPMRRSTANFVGPPERRKLGLAPGKPAPDPRVFRLRLECTALVDRCTGKPHLHMDEDWPALSAYPHTIDGGQEDRHAFRLAMYARRNSCESINAALKTFHKLGLSGASRTHTDNEAVVDLLISLALLSRTAVVAANERALRGLIPADPPAMLVASLDSSEFVDRPARPKRLVAAA
jgi:hypothetical protein